MDDSINLKELFQVLRKRLVMIVGITILAAVISAVISLYFITPIYQSSTQILMNPKADQENGGVQTSQIQTDLQMLGTYNVIVKSPIVLDKVANRLNLDVPAQALGGKIAFVREGESQVVSLTVTDSDPERAKDIANTTAEVFREEVFKMWSINNFTILSAADNGYQINYHPIRNILLAAAVGAAIAIALAFLLEYLDNTIKKEQDVEEILGLPVLGVITQIEEDKDGILQATMKVRGQTIGS